MNVSDYLQKGAAAVSAYYDTPSDQPASGPAPDEQVRRQASAENVAPDTTDRTFGPAGMGLRDMATSQYAMIGGGLLLAGLFVWALTR